MPEEQQCSAAVLRSEIACRSHTGPSRPAGTTHFSTRIVKLPTCSELISHGAHRAASGKNFMMYRKARLCVLEKMRRCVGTGYLVEDPERDASMVGECTKNTGEKIEVCKLQTDA